MIAELIGGALHLRPLPAPRYSSVTRALSVELRGPLGRGDNGPGGWIILNKPELHLGPEVLVPDLAAWRRERMPVLPDADWIELAPDWVCEVVSDVTRDAIAKRATYGEHGVGHLWLIDPVAQTPEAFALKDGAWTLLVTLTDDAIIELPPCEAGALSLAAL